MASKKIAPEIRKASIRNNSVFFAYKVLQVKMKRFIFALSLQIIIITSNKSNGTS